MTLNNVAFGKHQKRFEQMSYKQLSIYDFLPEEKSQEVQPSETDPQVDEAQDESIYYVLDSKGNTREFSPSSDLDTRTSNTLDKETYDAIVEECEEAFQPTEDTDNVGSESSTDSTLFSVGDTVKVKEAGEVYSYQHEFYDYLKNFSGKEFVILNYRLTVTGKHLFRAISKENGVENTFYLEELQKI
ncbi:hypothetical protein OB988_18685 [Bacillus cereus]|nr:hypothetical protein [Bacillus cereus]